SLTAFIGHNSQWDDVQWHIPIFIGGSAIVAAQIASHFSHYTNPEKLRKAFAYLLFLISAFTVLQTWL
ncbi:MAG: TSUP family transporter, partial [Actinobacteria bacterium]|nr:TSUP family transporter [Actinomycetota bacterium]